MWFFMLLKVLVIYIFIMSVKIDLLMLVWRSFIFCVELGWMIFLVIVFYSKELFYY